MTLVMYWVFGIRKTLRLLSQVFGDPSLHLGATYSKNEPIYTLTVMKPCHTDHCWKRPIHQECRSHSWPRQARSNYPTHLSNTNNRLHEQSTGRRVQRVGQVESINNRQAMANKVIRKAK